MIMKTLFCRCSLEWIIFFATSQSKSNLICSVSVAHVNSAMIFQKPASFCVFTTRLGVSFSEQCTASLIHLLHIWSKKLFFLMISQICVGCILFPFSVVVLLFIVLYWTFFFQSYFYCQLLHCPFGTLGKLVFQGIIIPYWTHRTFYHGCKFVQWDHLMQKILS